MKVYWIWLFMLDLVMNIYAAYPYKMRGPPMPPRPPSPPAYIKKWYMGNRFPTAYRPMYTRPVMAYPVYKPRPMMQYPKATTAAPLIFPASLWKQPVTFKAPILAKPAYIHASPQANLIPEYHFKLEQPIHQVDEKGPIHTIPAPNLSLADKPIVVAEYTGSSEPAHQYQFIQNEVPVALGLQQYQVTEQQSDQSVEHKYYAPDPDPSIAGPIIPPAMDPHSIPTNSKPPPSDLYSGSDAPQQLSSQDILQLLQGYTPQQQLLDSYGLPISQQPQLQQHLLQQSQPAGFEQTYYIQKESTVKDFQPNFQNFNYDEQTRQNTVPGSGFEASYDTAGSHSQHIRTTQEYTPSFVGYNSVDQMVQSNVVDGNYNQPDPATIYAQLTQSLQNNYHGQMAGPLHYTTVPSQEVAEKLASLHQAGQIISQQVEQPHEPMRIVVPDEDDVDEHDKSDNVEAETNEVDQPEEGDYNDGADIHDDVKAGEKEEEKKPFGSRIKAKN